MTPKLSIITVNLNNRGGLARTAESIVAQTWADYEWIVIDGGSTDGSADVIREYVDKTSKLVYWCSERDGGIYYGMNKGIAKASGEYCYFLNSGDYLRESTVLEKIFAVGFDEDIIYGNMMQDKGNGKYLVRRYGDKVRPSDLVYGAIQHQNMFFRTTLLKEKKGYRTDYKIASDWVFYMEAICVEKASYRHINVVFAINESGGMSDNAKFWGIFKEERKMAIKEMFSRKQRFFYIFTAASLRSKIGKIGYRVEKILCKRSKE